MNYQSPVYSSFQQGIEYLQEKELVELFENANFLSTKSQHSATFGSEEGKFMLWFMDLVEFPIFSQKEEDAPQDEE